MATPTVKLNLGSSSFITTAGGYATEHLQYTCAELAERMAYGEDFIHQQNTSNYYTPYTFSAKEKDAETGFSYFGARYYADNLSIWLSVDPLADKRSWLTPYNYCQNNPIGRIDPTGALDGETDDWVRLDNGKLTFDPSIKASLNQSVTTCDGAKGCSLGASATLSNGSQTTSLNSDGSISNSVPLNEVGISAQGGGGVDWGMVGNGAVTTTGGVLAVSLGIAAVSSGVAASSAVILLPTGSAAMGFGISQMVAGFSGKKVNIPGGLGEAFDRGFGGSGTVGQIIDIGSGGLPSTALDAALMGYGLYNSNLGQMMMGPLQLNNGYNNNPFVTPRDNTNVVLPYRRP